MDIGYVVFGAVDGAIDVVLVRISVAYYTTLDQFV